MPGLSIIIPTYNAAEHISEMLDSILHQTFQDWELIVVDDCSTDQTQAIIQQYIAKDERISLITMPTNTGSARLPERAGVRISISPYVSCVDQDDTLDYDYFEKLIHRIDNTEADAVCSILSPFSENNISYPTIPSPDFNLGQILSGVDACLLTLKDWKINANGWVVKRPLLLQILNENDDHYMNSDEVDTRKVLYYSHRVAFSDAHYNYRIHSESITHKISPKLYDILITNNQLYKFIINTTIPLTRPQVIKSLSFECISTLILYKKMFLHNKKSYSKDQQNNLRHTIRNAFNGIKLNRTTFPTTKLSLIFCSFIAFQMYTQLTYQIEKLKYE